MAKPIFPTTHEPSENIVHISPPGLLDTTTLCGHLSDEQPTDEPKAVTCDACIAIVEYCRKYRLP